LSVIEKAMAGVKGRVTYDDDGYAVLTGVSGPTNPTTLDGYNTIPQRDDLSYGIGATIMALIESSGLPASE